MQIYHLIFESMKKVLIITYYWPPSGGSGVQRWYKFAKYLPDFGWQPIIYTPIDPKFGIMDVSLSSDDGNNIKVIRTKIWDIGTLFNKKGKPLKIGEINNKKTSLISKLMIWIRGNFFIPDSKISWVKPSIKKISAELAKTPVDLIVTTGPPHSMHLIGLGLKKKLGIKWVADFRDPWSDGDLIEQLNISKRAFRKHQHLEKEVLKNADAVVAVGEMLGESFRLKFNDSNLKIITNGYDQSDFDSGEVEPGIQDKFKLTYSGLLYNNRNPNLLWDVLDELCLEDKEFNEQLEVHIAGLVDPGIEQVLKGYKCLGSKISFHGYLSHTESIQLCLRSTALILPVDNTKNTMMLIPGKLFEYLAANVPILGFGIPGSDASKILTTSGHQALMSYTNKAKITQRVSTLFNDFKNGEVKIKYEHEQYQRRALSRKMSAVFNKLVD